ncbi:MAG: T9SS type A sorting domain-containing protein [Bacteroidales bacterium]
MKKTIFSIFLLISLSVLLISWGAVGHKKISESSSLSFNAQMQDFLAWVDFLRDHASDADYRKDTDPTEGMKHYLDVDNYPEFIATGTIPQTLDSAIALHGLAFVEDNGILPWAIERTFDSLRNCMQRLDFTKAQIFAADLGHYVADGHMPLHITKNYNGQFTGNTGIHSRYESTMINAHIGEIVYTGEDATEILNVNQYIFEYLYANYIYCDSVIAADNYAKAQSGNYSSTAYKNALWLKSQNFTIPLYKRGSHALADLIYTAWIQAGSPSLIASEIPDPISISNAVLEQNHPNPFVVSTEINFTLKENTRVLLQVRDINGSTVATLIDKSFPAGNQTCMWVPDSVASGLYYLVLNTGKYIQVKKMVYSGGK